MRALRVGAAWVECVRGDIVRQPDLDAIVNAANAELGPGGGVAGAIHRAAGPGLYEECRPLAPIRPGEAVVTRGHHLPNRWVIHCLGPVYGIDAPPDRLLSDCYRNVLRLAHERRMRSIGFPAISTGAFGYPMEPATRIAVDTVVRELIERPFLEIVRFVLFDTTAEQLYQRVLAEK